MKDFANVPGDESIAGTIAVSNRFANGSTVEAAEPFVEARGAVGGFRYEDDAAVVGGRQREGAFVEKLVVEYAEGDSVPDVVGTTRLAPLDVGGVERHRSAAEADVERANGAFLLVGAQHRVPKAGIAHTPRAREDAVGIDATRLKAHGLKNVVVARFREMRCEEVVCDLGDQPVVGAQSVVDVPGQTASDTVGKKVSLVGIATSGTANAAGAVKLPDAVPLQAPERKLGVDRSPRRPEITKQPAEPGIDGPIRSHPAFAAQATADGPQREETLVRRAYAALSPDSKLTEESLDPSSVHAGSYRARSESTARRNRRRAGPPPS